MYRLDTRRLSWKESWRHGGLVLLVCKTVGFNIGGTQPTAMDFGTLEPVDVDDLPLETYQHWKELLEQVEELGFDFRLIYRMPNPEGNRSYGIFCSDKKSITALQLLYCQNKDLINVAIGFTTRLESGLELTDSDQKQKWDPLPGILDRHHPGKGMDTIWAHHRARLVDVEPRLLPHNKDEILKALSESNQKWMAWAKSRGILVPIEEG